MTDAETASMLGRPRRARSLILPPLLLVGLGVIQVGSAMASFGSVPIALTSFGALLIAALLHLYFGFAAYQRPTLARISRYRYSIVVSFAVAGVCLSNLPGQFCFVFAGQELGSSHAKWTELIRLRMTSTAWFKLAVGLMVVSLGALGASILVRQLTPLAVSVVIEVVMVLSPFAAGMALRFSRAPTNPSASAAFKP